MLTNNLAQVRDFFEMCQNKQWASMGCDDAVTNTADFINPAALPSCPTGGADEPRKPLVAVCCGTTTRKVSQPAISKLALFRYVRARARACPPPHAILSVFQ